MLVYEIDSGVRKTWVQWCWYVKKTWVQSNRWWIPTIMIGSAWVTGALVFLCLVWLWLLFVGYTVFLAIKVTFPETVSKGLSNELSMRANGTGYDRLPWPKRWTNDHKHDYFFWVGAVHLEGVSQMNTLAPLEISFFFFFFFFKF